MTLRATFRRIPLDQLLEHEEVDSQEVRALADRIRAEGVVTDPIWVAAGEDVVLNGHHRVAALRRLGARYAPAWVLEYDSAAMRLERWSPGPALTKEEVLRRARAGEKFPLKTTRHILEHDLPPHPTKLSDLFEGPVPDAPVPVPNRATAQRRGSGRSRRSASRAPGSG